MARVGPQRHRKKMVRNTCAGLMSLFFISAVIYVDS